jgi:hypothetical protein
MTTKVFASLFVLFLVFLSAANVAFAQEGGAANGVNKFTMEDELGKYVEFDARTDERGNTTGYMQFTDEARLLFQDVDGTGEKSTGDPVEFYMAADIDRLVIEKNRAVISGVVRNSSIASYVGKWVQLVIEDNDGIEVPDKLVWTFCNPEAGGWIPEDAEVKGDRGAYMSWWATDAERKDDVGIPSKNQIPGNLKGCRVLPLQSYEFAPIVKGEGRIYINQP